jgi:hypothetical protein
MAALLPNPEPQFCDPNGKPYAGGTIATYIVGTSTPKPTWVDPLQASLNSNPVELDSAGRCILYGDGDYRLVLSDAAGNLIWDQPSSTIVSAAMEPVMGAATIADALNLLGVNDAIAVEAAARAAADTTETNARVAADTAEQNARIAEDSNLQTEITNEVNRASGVEATLTARPLVQGGVGDASSGHCHITFAPAFANCVSFVACIQGNTYTSVTLMCQFNNAGADVYVSQGGRNVPGSAPINWVAVGS